MSSVAVDDGKFVGDSDVGEFWSFFGGYAPIPRDVPSDQTPSDSSIKLFWLVPFNNLFLLCLMILISFHLFISAEFVLDITCLKTKKRKNMG